MFPTEKNVNHLFGPNVQYQVPIYQRRYVWNAANWDTLWNDIRTQVELKRRGEDNSRHFMGVIVARPIESGQLAIFEEVIDGQQRLATFQIILCAIRDICQSAGSTDMAEQTNSHILNSQIVVTRSGTPDAQYKFLPTQPDKETFSSIVDGNPTKNSHPLMLRAYDYFKAQITSYVDGDYEKIDRLLSAILHDFVVVHIILDESDASENIFATLNARGERLSEFDLLRNSIFLRTGAYREELYLSYWVHFEEDPFWTTEILEQFLRDFLTAKLEIDIETDDLFTVYERKYRPTLEADQGLQDVEHELAELSRYAEVYRERIELDA